MIFKNVNFQLEPTHTHLPGRIRMRRGLGRSIISIWLWKLGREELRAKHGKFFIVQLFLVYMCEEKYRNWLQKAESDFRKAKILFDNSEYDGATFFCQQCIEKGLKAFLIKEKRELIKTHSVILLAKKLDLPEEFLNKISVFQPIYQATRYPNMAIESQPDEFNQETAQRLLSVSG